MRILMNRSSVCCWEGWLACDNAHTKTDVLHCIEMYGGRLHEHSSEHGVISGRCCSLYGKLTIGIFCILAFVCCDFSVCVSTLSSVECTAYSTKCARTHGIFCTGQYVCVLCLSSWMVSIVCWSQTSCVHGRTMHLPFLRARTSFDLFFRGNCCLRSAAGIVCAVCARQLVSWMRINHVQLYCTQLYSSVNTFDIRWRCRFCACISYLNRLQLGFECLCCNDGHGKQAPETCIVVTPARRRRFHVRGYKFVKTCQRSAK